jgi:muramidase (phage lysozyme)
VSPSSEDLIAWEQVAEEAVGAMVNAGEVTQPVLDEFTRVLSTHRAASP